ncbi:MAG: nuclear transport factor 2 family protein [Gammaproteobacteria bacterium]
MIQTLAEAVFVWKPRLLVDDIMNSTAELKTAQGMTSAEFIADRVKEAYQSLVGSQISEVESLYSSDVYFEDPSHAIQGKSELISYFTKMFSRVERCKFKFHSTISDGSDVFMTWTMFLNHPRLRGGETIRVEGSSYFKTRNGKIYFHRDYFDLGAMIYEHLPLLGRIIVKIKQRLGQ